MSGKLNFLTDQFSFVDNWSTNLIEDVPESQWGIVPELGTSINWLVGHQLISKYFHAVLSVLNMDGVLIQELNKEMPIEEYFKYYFAGSDPLADWDKRPGKEELMKHWHLMNAVCMEMIPLLNIHSLDQPTEMKNPVAATKYEALTFAFKHQMWHNGQIAMLKRIQHIG